MVIMSAPKLTIQSIIDLYKKSKQKVLKFSDLRINYKTLLRVKILTPGLYLEEICCDTPILGASGVAISVELIFTYLNRGLMLELIDDCYLEDMYLLIMLTFEYNKDKNPAYVEGRLQKPLSWIIDKINNEELRNIMTNDNPLLLSQEDPVVKKAIEGIEAAKELDDKLGILNDPRLTPRLKEKVKKKQLKHFIGKTIEEKVDEKTGRVKIVKKRRIGPGLSQALFNEVEEGDPFTIQEGDKSNF